VVVVLVVFVLTGVFIYGLSKLEPFHRIMTIATVSMHLLIALASAGAFVFMYMTVLRGGFGKLKKSKINIKNVGVSFDDVVGLKNAKKEALEIVKIIKDRKNLQRVVGKIINGILLIGPPGCGKTLLAKAIATECNVPFISVSGSEFIEVFVGVGASRVRSLFKKAREYAYTDGVCVVFIDEIEAIGRSRVFSYMGSSEEMNSTQNQLLVEMDGLENKKSNIIVIAATNADENILDTALLRPGRFGRKIAVMPPNLKERMQLFEFYLKSVKVSFEVSSNLNSLAKKTVYKSPADIENIIGEATLIAAREKKDTISIKNLFEAMDRTDLGMETHIDMTSEELEMVAYHEAGHAVAMYSMHPTDDVFKVSIRPRQKYLGVVSPLPKAELHTEYKEELLADIMVALAGYVATKVKYNTTTTSVNSDFRCAMLKANYMVWEVGMGDSGFIGDFSTMSSENMSQSLKEKLNNDTISLLNLCYRRVEELLKKNWDCVDTVAENLIVEKELDFDRFEKIMETSGTKKKLDSNVE
jgi:cell division protease FtsH